MSVKAKAVRDIGMLLQAGFAHKTCFCISCFRAQNGGGRHLVVFITIFRHFLNTFFQTSPESESHLYYLASNSSDIMTRLNIPEEQGDGLNLL